MMRLEHQRDGISHFITSRLRGQITTRSNWDFLGVVQHYGARHANISGQE